MSRSWFLNKVARQGIFKGQQKDFLSWSCFFRCLLLPFFALFLHCSPILMAHCKIFHVTATLKFKIGIDQTTHGRSIKEAISLKLEQFQSIA